MSFRRPYRWIASAIVAFAPFGWSTIALAHSSGQPGPGCVGCHKEGSYGIAMATSPASFSPGDKITVTMTLTPASGVVAGTFIEASTGTLATIAGQGLASVNMGLTHTSPKSISGGKVSFAFNWTAPNQPGAVRFEASTVVANDNNSSSGDQGSFGEFDFVYGCEAFTYFRDADGDGKGQDAKTMISCVGATPQGYSTVPGDCNDNDEDIFPGATEVCNKVDDDCDGEIDDGAIPLDLYLDEDGDGYYGNAEFQMGVQGVGCVPAEGFAGYSGDCEPTVTEVHPDAEEVCNLIDDNCDGRIDEKVRPRCGEGWCTREAPTCDPESCIPGEPRAEECNLLDDNCDAIVDEGVVCGVGLACVGGACVDAALAPVGPGGTAAGGGNAEEDDGGCAVKEGPTTASVVAVVVMGGAAAWVARRRRRRREGER